MSLCPHSSPRRAPPARPLPLNPGPWMLPQTLPHATRRPRTRPTVPRVAVAVAVGGRGGVGRQWAPRGGPNPLALSSSYVVLRAACACTCARVCAFISSIHVTSDGLPNLVRASGSLLWNGDDDGAGRLEFSSGLNARTVTSPTAVREFPMSSFPKWTRHGVSVATAGGVSCDDSRFTHGAPFPGRPH